MPTKRRASKVPFTVPNVRRSLMKILGGDTEALLSIEKGCPACDVIIQSPRRELWPLDNFVIWRDLDANARVLSENLPYDEDYGFFDIGGLSNEEILRLMAKCWGLSGLRHWIISEGRSEGLSDAEIKTSLAKPLETLIAAYDPEQEDGWDDVMATFVSQCRPDYLVLGRRIIKVLGGIHKVRTSDLFVETPEGFIIHLIGKQDIATFKKLMKRSGHGRILA